MSRKYAWTISIIAQIDPAYLIEFNELVEDIERQKFNESIRYIIFRYDQHPTSGGLASVLSFEANRVTGNQNLITLSSPFQADLYNSETLINFFTNHVLKDSYSDKHMVITWGHGAGMGYFSRRENNQKGTNYFSGIHGLDDPATTANANRKLNTLTFLAANLSLEINKNKFIDETYSSFKGRDFGFSAIDAAFDSILPTIIERLKLISAKQLAEILNKSFGLRQVDILVSVNCYMQMLETGFELRNQVTLLAAGQTTFPFAGYNFSKLFENIHSGNITNEKGVAMDLKKNFLKKYKEGAFANIFSNRWKEFNINTVAFSVNDLGRYNNIMAAMNALADFIVLNYETIFEKQKLSSIVWSGRFNCEDLTDGSDYGIIDIKNFFIQCNSFLKNKNNDLQYLYEQYSTASSDCKVEFHKPPGPPDLYECSILGKSKSPDGLSIYFPSLGDKESADIIMGYFYSKQPVLSTVFVNQSTWDDFVRFFYDKLKAKKE